MSTYGDYRDETALALAYLVGNPGIQATAEQLEHIVGCRDIVLTSLQHQYRLATGAAGAGSLRLAAIEDNPTAAFGAVLERLPRAGAGHAPTDVLTSVDQGPLVKAWQHAARSSLLAADVLDTTHAWRPNAEAAWAVVSDVAAATSALSLLDRDLTAAAEAHDDPQTAQQLHGSSTTGIGLLSAITRDVARSGPLHPDVDRLARSVSVPVRAQPLRRFSDAADGQRRVAAMLRQREGVLPSKALGPVLVGQARIATAIAEIAARLQRPHPSGALLDDHQRQTAAALTGAARARAEALTTMARSRKGIADTLNGGEHVAWQTAEIVRALERRPAPKSTAAAYRQLTYLQELAANSDRVNTALAHGITKTFAAGHYLVPLPNVDRLQWRPCTPEADPALRQAAEGLDQVLKDATLPRRLDTRTRTTPHLTSPSAMQQLRDAVAARTPGRPTTPGMDAGQPLSP